MEQMDIKKIINEELSDLTVTERLKFKTLNKISPKKQWINFKVLRILSLASSFIIMFTLGINLIAGSFNDTTLSRGGRGRLRTEDVQKAPYNTELSITEATDDTNEKTNK